MPNQVRPPSTKSIRSPSQSRTLLATAATRGLRAQLGDRGGDPAGCRAGVVVEEGRGQSPVACFARRGCSRRRTRCCGRPRRRVACGTASRMRARCRPGALSTQISCEPRRIVVLGERAQAGDRVVGAAVVDHDHRDERLRFPLRQSQLLRPVGASLKARPSLPDRASAECRVPADPATRASNVAGSRAAPRPARGSAGRTGSSRAAGPSGTQRQHGGQRREPEQLVHRDAARARSAAA